MPRAEHQPVNALLPAAAGERRDIGVDEIDRQAVHKVSVLRQSPDRGQPGAGWHKGRASSRAPPDATDGPGGSIQAAKDEPAASGPSGLPLLAEGYGDHASQSGLVLGHHLRWEIDPRSISSPSHSPSAGVISTSSPSWTGQRARCSAGGCPTPCMRTFASMR